MRRLLNRYGKEEYGRIQGILSNLSDEMYLQPVDVLERDIIP